MISPYKPIGDNPAQELKHHDPKAQDCRLEDQASDLDGLSRRFPNLKDHPDPRLLMLSSTSSASCSVFQASGIKLAATNTLTAMSIVNPFPFRACCSLFSNLRGKKCSFQLLLTNPFLNPIANTLAVEGPLTFRGTLCPRRGWW